MMPESLATVDADTAAAAVDWVLLDVREDDEWMSGHAPNALHISMGQLQSRVDELDRGQRIVCICRSGGRSARVTQWLQQQGFDAVNMSGGMFAWAAGGHPMINQHGEPGTVA